MEYNFDRVLYLVPELQIFPYILNQPVSNFTTESHHCCNLDGYIITSYIVNAASHSKLPINYRV